MTVRLPGEVAVLRERIRHLAQGSEIDVDAAILITSEVVTNALVHSGGPTQVRASIRPADGMFRVEADDSSISLPGTPVEPSPHGGRGLMIVDQLATRWGVEPRLPVGKTVWVEIDP